MLLLQLYLLFLEEILTASVRNMSSAEKDKRKDGVKFNLHLKISLVVMQLLERTSSSEKMQPGEKCER